MPGPKVGPEEKRQGLSPALSIAGAATDDDSKLDEAFHMRQC